MDDMFLAFTMVQQVRTECFRAVTEREKVAVITKAVFRTMPATVHRPLKIIAFNANGIGNQACNVRNQLQDLKIDMALFSETHLKHHMRFYIPQYDIYQTDHEDWHKGGAPITVKKGIPHTCIYLPPALSVEAAGVCRLVETLK
jgi:hypothetical protein